MTEEFFKASTENPLPIQNQITLKSDDGEVEVIRMTKDSNGILIITIKITPWKDKE